MAKLVSAPEMATINRGSIVYCLPSDSKTEPRPVNGDGVRGLGFAARYRSIGSFQVVATGVAGGVRGTAGGVRGAAGAVGRGEGAGVGDTTGATSVTGGGEAGTGGETAAG